MVEIEDAKSTLTARNAQLGAANLRLATALRDGRVLLDDQQRMFARRVVGLTVEPSEGDLLLVAMTADHRCWVLAVLASTSDSVQMDAAGASAVELRLQRLTLSATDRLQTIAASYCVHGGRLDAVIGELALSGKRLVSNVKAWALGARDITVSCRRWVQRSGDRVVSVDGSDQVEARHVVVRADSTLALSAQQAQLKGERSVLVDGERIIMG